MKGIIGCDADSLKPGAVVMGANGARITIIRKVSEAEALASAARSDLPVKPVAGEHWYEAEIALAPVTSN
jgi:hypothetical protein